MMLDLCLGDVKIISKEFNTCKNSDIRVIIYEYSLISNNIFYFIEIKSKNKWLKKLLGGEYYEVSLNNHVFDNVNENISLDIIDILTKLNLVLDKDELDKFIKSIDFIKYEKELLIKIREKKYEK